MIDFLDFIRAPILTGWISLFLSNNMESFYVYASLPFCLALSIWSGLRVKAKMLTADAKEHQSHSYGCCQRIGTLKDYFSYFLLVLPIHIQPQKNSSLDARYSAIHCWHPQSRLLSAAEVQFQRMINYLGKLQKSTCCKVSPPTFVSESVVPLCRPLSSFECTDQIFSYNFVKIYRQNTAEERPLVYTFKPNELKLFLLIFYFGLGNVYWTFRFSAPVILLFVILKMFYCDGTDGRDERTDWTDGRSTKVSFTFTYTYQNYQQIFLRVLKFDVKFQVQNLISISNWV